MPAWLQIERTCYSRSAANGFGADRYFDAKASLLISERNYTAAIQVLTSHCFASYLGERPSLVNKWCKFTTTNNNRTVTATLCHPVAVYSTCLANSVLATALHMFQIMQCICWSWSVVAIET